MSGLVKDLTDKVVLITGASSGIGRATAIEFAKNGAKLALSGRNPETLQETLSLCVEQGQTQESHVHLIVADLQQPEECKRIVQETVAQFGKLDVLVNSAGIIITGPIEQWKLEDYDRIMNINARSIFLIIQTAIPYLKESKGSIVNVSSISGIRTIAGTLAYGMSKAALDQLTKIVALELAPHGVRCNSVNPGIVQTNILKTMGLDEKGIEQLMEHWKNNHALGRLGESHEISSVIVFLASNTLSGFITGVNLPVDGGISIMCAR